MSDTSSNLSSTIQNAQSVVIMYPRQPSAEVLAVATALTLTLQNQGKDVSLLSPQLPESSNSFVGLDLTKTELGRQNLLVSFDYSEDKVDKISYHIGEETGKFYLTIKPKKGFAPLDSKSVEFSYAGMETDAIILVGVVSLDSLDQLYVGYEEIYEKTPTIVISPSPLDIQGAQITAGSHSGLAEAIAIEIKNAGLSITPDAATNLLLGIDEATDDLSRGNLSADTFQTVADLIRAGGVRILKEKKQPKKQSFTSASTASPSRKKPQETEMKVEVRRGK